MQFTLGNAWIWQEVDKHLQTGTGVLYVLGPAGIGKTHIIKELCRHHDMEVFWIDSYNCASNKELQDMLVKQTSTNILQCLQQSSGKRCIIIDELETLTQFDRNILATIETFEKCHIPFVCIGNKSLEKKIAKALVCTAPTEADICVWLKAHTDGKIPCAEVLQIAETCNGNLHTALQMASKVTDKHDVQLTVDDMFVATCRDEICCIINEDQWLIPLRFHENLPSDLSTRKMTPTQKQRFYHSVLESFVCWDLMMQHGSSAIAIETIASSIIRLNNIPTKSGNAQKADMSSFTKLFSNLSLQKKNEKKTYSTDSSFPWTHAQIFCDYIKYR